MSRPTRREFLERAASVAAVAAAFQPASAAAQPRAIPYVDGLSFMSPDPDDVAKSGLTAFICDVSSVSQVKTDDGSVRYYRSFEACAKSMTAMRRTLAEGKVPGTFLAVRDSDIEDAFKNHRTAVFFQFQGAEPIGDQLWRLDMFHDLGLRVLQITHHNDNPWGGGAIERKWTGLTAVGREGVERLNAQCAPDEVIRGVGESGGVMGIFMVTMWLTTDPQPSVDAYVRQLRHVAKVAGIDAVGIANDYSIAGELTAAKVGNDNAKIISNYYAWWDSVAKQGVMGFDTRPPHAVIPELNNVRRMFLIHEALDRSGFKAAEVEKIMGGNWIRVLKSTLARVPRAT